MGKGSSVTWIAMMLVAWALWLAWPKRMIDVRSPVTGKVYTVKNAAGAQEVADRLAALELRVRKFLDEAEALVPGDARLANIRKRWNGTLSEIENTAEVAYSLGKDSVAVCVRSAAGQMEPDNTAMFVLIHELAHIASDKYGHTSEFWDNMQFLLELAERTGLYSYQPFESGDDAYCGFPLKSSPLTCVKKGTCAAMLPPPANPPQN